MNHHAPPTTDEPAQSLTAHNRAKDRRAMIDAASECVKRADQCRRQMARWARIGHHVWAWEEHQSIIQHMKRRRWYLDRARQLPIQFVTEDAA